MVLTLLVVEEKDNMSWSDAIELLDKSKSLSTKRVPLSFAKKHKSTSDIGYKKTDSPKSGTGFLFPGETMNKSIWAETIDLLLKAQPKVVGGTVAVGETSKTPVVQQTSDAKETKESTNPKIKNILGYKQKPGVVGGFKSKPGVLPEGSGFPLPGQRLMTKKEIQSKRLVEAGRKRADRLRRFREEYPRRKGASGRAESTVGPFDILSGAFGAAKLGAVGAKALTKWGAKKLAETWTKQGGKVVTQQVKNLTDDAIAAAAKKQPKVKPKTQTKDYSPDAYKDTGTMPKSNVTRDVRGKVDPHAKTLSGPPKLDVKQVWRNKLVKKIKNTKDLRTQGISPRMLDDVIDPTHMKLIKTFVQNKMKSDPKLKVLSGNDWMEAYSRLLSEITTKAVQHNKGYQKSLIKYMETFGKSWNETIDILKSICGIEPEIMSSWDGALQLLEAI